MRARILAVICFLAALVPGCPTSVERATTSHGSAVVLSPRSSGDVATTPARPEEPAASSAAPCASVSERFTSRAGALVLEPPLRFDIDSVELERGSLAALREVCAATRSLPRIDVRVVVHPDVAQSYRHRSRDLPRDRARSLERTLRELSCAEEIDAGVDVDDTMPVAGPPEVRFRIPDCAM